MSAAAEVEAPGTMGAVVGGSSLVCSHASCLGVNGEGKSRRDK